MIVKIPLVLALVSYINGVSSASFSKVYVQNGPEYPMEYVQYGAPSVSYSPHTAQLTAAPVGSVVPYPSNYVPCGTPCIYPGQVASVAPSAQIVQYKSTSLPVVVAPSRSEPSGGYEYSYVVYDEETGDHKIQRELSDGSLVRGGYSFLQPDGYVRDVQYVADDVQGFNAVVKNYLPANKKHDHTEKPEVAPCHEVKNDHLKVDESHHESNHESHHEEPSHENLKAHHEEHHVEANEDIKHEQPEHHEAHEEHHEAHVEPNDELNEAHKEHHESHEELHKTHAKPHDEHHEAHEEHHETEAEPHGEHHDEHHEAHEEHHETEAEPHGEHHEENHETEPVEELIVVIEEHHASHNEPHGAHHKVHVEHHTEETLEKHAPSHHKEVHEEHPHEEHEVHQSHSESIQEHAKSSEEPKSHIEPEVHENHEHHLAVSGHDIGNSNVLVPYNDIIRCIQAALSGINDASSPHKAESPLTYIVLNKPC